MRRMIARGYKRKKRPSGHNITDKFQADRGGSIPSNVLMRGNKESNSPYIRLCTEYGIKPHPARFPSALPEFYIKFLTRLSGLVVDPFAGSNTTGAVAESLHRQWLAFETEPRYVENSKLRFGLISRAIEMLTNVDDLLATATKVFSSSEIPKPFALLQAADRVRRGEDPAAIARGNQVYTGKSSGSS